MYFYYFNGNLSLTYLMHFDLNIGNVCEFLTSSGRSLNNFKPIKNMLFPAISLLKFGILKSFLLRRLIIWFSLIYVSSLHK